MSFTSVAQASGSTHQYKINLDSGFLHVDMDAGPQHPVFDLYTSGIKLTIRVSDGFRVSCRGFDTSGSKSQGFLVVALCLQPPKAKELQTSAIDSHSKQVS